MQPHKQLVDAFCAAKQIKANTRFTDVKGKFFKCQVGFLKNFDLF